MKDAIRMVGLLGAITMLCGLLLSGVNQATAARIALQRLTFIKGPAVKSVLSEAENNPLEDRYEVTIDSISLTVFPAKKDGHITRIAFETAAGGYGGSVEVITGFAVESGECIGVEVTGSQETPGIGSKVADESFCKLFLNVSQAAAAALKKDGGSIDGISGATISSRAVCSAVGKACRLFPAVKNKIRETEK